MEAQDLKQDLLRLKIKRQCAKDPVFFINNFVKTYDPRITNPYLPFKLWDFQEEFVKKLHNALIYQKDLLIDKSRDMGATWCCISFMIWAWLFYPGYQCLIGSKKEDDVDRGGLPSTMFGKMDIIIKKLPLWLLPRGWDYMRYRNFMRLQNPENDNSISGESANPHFSRSGRYSQTFLDEYAFWESAESVWNCTGDSSDSRILISTPNGMGNTFADVRFGGNIDYTEMHWRSHPKKGAEAWYDEENQIWRSPWYDKEVERRLTGSDASLKNIKQELDISYIQSGDPVFPQNHLKLHSIKEIHPSLNETYAIGADVSEGLEGGDESSFDIIAKSTGQQVFSWQGKITTEEFAWKLIEFGNHYNQALLGVEANNAGIAVLNIIKKNYRKIYYQKRYDNRSDIVTQKIGWNTNKKTKPQMILDLQGALIEKEIKVTHSKTLDQLSIYASDGAGKYGAPQGKHDDAVSSLAIAWQVLKDVKMPLSEEETYKKERKQSKRKSHRRFVSTITGY